MFKEHILVDTWYKGPCVLLIDIDYWVLSLQCKLSIRKTEYSRLAPVLAICEGSHSSHQNKGSLFLSVHSSTYPPRHQKLGPKIIDFLWKIFEQKIKNECHKTIHLQKQNNLKIPLKNLETLRIFLNHLWNTIETLFEHPWNLSETPL